MLRFIDYNTNWINPPSRFKYISCYGLSYSTAVCIQGAKGFKYISCYGLSKKTSITPNVKKLFKYISCYGLSQLYQLKLLS